MGVYGKASEWDEQGMHLQFAHRDTQGRSASLSNLAVHISTRYKELGAMQDLGEVIPLSRDALALCGCMLHAFYPARTPGTGRPVSSDGSLNGATYSV